MTREGNYARLLVLLKDRNDLLDQSKALTVSIDVLHREKTSAVNTLDCVYAEIMKILVEENVQSIETPIGKPTRIKGKPIVEIVDETLVPEMYKIGTASIPVVEIPPELVSRFAISINKNIVAAALKDGDVPGAELVDGREYLKIM